MILRISHPSRFSVLSVFDICNHVESGRYVCLQPQVSWSICIHRIEYLLRSGRFAAMQAYVMAVYEPQSIDAAFN